MHGCILKLGAWASGPAPTSAESLPDIRERGMWRRAIRAAIGDG